ARALEPPNRRRLSVARDQELFVLARRRPEGGPLGIGDETREVVFDLGDRERSAEAREQFPNGLCRIVVGQRLRVLRPLELLPEKVIRGQPNQRLLGGEQRQGKPRAGELQPNEVESGVHLDNTAGSPARQEEDVSRLESEPPSDL